MATKKSTGKLLQFDMACMVTLNGVTLKAGVWEYTPEEMELLEAHEDYKFLVADRKVKEVSSGKVAADKVAI